MLDAGVKCIVAILITKPSWVPVPACSGARGARVAVPAAAGREACNGRERDRETLLKIEILC